MITKKEILIFSIAVLALLVFAFNVDESKKLDNISFDTKEDQLLVNKIKYKTADQALTQEKRIQKNDKDLRIFRKRLTTNNLSKALKQAKSYAPKSVSNKVPTSKVAKVDKKKKKKKDDKKKKKVAKKKADLKPINPLAPETDQKIAQKTKGLESTDLSSMSYTQNFNHNNKTTPDNEAKEVEEEVILAENQPESKVSSFGQTDIKTAEKKSIFTKLLENERFSEFEQLLNSELSEKQRIQSYKDSLNFLFGKTDGEFQNFNTFVKNQFFNDKYAVIISKSLSDPKMTFDQVRYTVSYLNQMILEWNAGEAGNNVFKQIYQDNVMTILSQNEERRDLFTGLQSSIEAKSLLLNENSIEVSAN